MNDKRLSTGQAAKLCSVTPDTILKWIYAGRLPAYRTGGGHHRIDPKDLEELLERSTATVSTPGRLEIQSSRHCWEFYGRSTVPATCRQCVVYRAQALRCYELAKLPADIGHEKLFCQGGCEDCDYYIAARNAASSAGDG